MKKIILGIETSCDETALALVAAEGNFTGKKNIRFKVLKSLISSQIEIHRPFGGVVPNIAKREHLKNLPVLFNQLFPENQKKLPVDLIAVTVGPGLEPALWAGITFAQGLAKKYSAKGGSASGGKKLTLLGVNHLEGHLYSNWLPHLKKISAQGATPAVGQGPTLGWHLPKFPAISLVVSGGHTILLLMKDYKTWKKLGETRDDAAGEAFDKVARLLKLLYPGGPEIQKLAIKGNPHAIEFPRPMMAQKNYEFSFSGLKTSVLYYLRDNKKINKADIAASAQEAIVDVLATKTIRAAKEFGAKSILLSGGVAANRPLRKRLQKESKKAKLAFFVPDFEYNTDNAVMIAVSGYFNYLRKKNYRLVARGDMNI